MAKDNFIRTFVAVELPKEVRGELKKIQQQLKPFNFPVKWVEPEQIHLTLSFLGDVLESRIDKLYEAVEKGRFGIKPFTLKPSSLGCSPNFKKPRVVWIGLEGEAEILAKLQKQIEENLLAYGFQPRVREKFTAHLTFGRVRRKATGGERLRLGQKLQKLIFTPFAQVIKVETVSIIKSDLFPIGPVYTKLRETKLSSQSSL